MEMLPTRRWTRLPVFDPGYKLVQQFCSTRLWTKPQSSHLHAILFILLNVNTGCTNQNNRKTDSIDLAAPGPIRAKLSCQRAITLATQIPALTES